MSESSAKPREWIKVVASSELSRGEASWRDAWTGRVLERKQAHASRRFRHKHEQISVARALESMAQVEVEEMTPTELPHPSRRLKDFSWSYFGV